MIRIVPLKFQQAGRQYDFNALTLELKAGDKVIVETDRGRAMATVVIPPREIQESEAPEGLKSILRIATEEDLALAETNAAREKTAHRFCKERIHERKLEMKLVRAEYAFDGSKIIFFFTADGRIDFRELVKDLAHHFHTRIEMRQIGVRDEAKLVGGLGICGRELCCCSFLTQFSPVSVKMAKEQGLALNPTKISGQCGRLLCCLGYEYETYGELKKGMPKCGKKVMWENRECEVTSQDVLQQKVTLRDREGTCCRVTMEELRTGQPSPPAAQENPDEETHASRLTKDRPQRQQQQPRKQGEKGQQPQRQADKGQQPRKQASKGQQPQKQINKRQQPADKAVEDKPRTVEVQPERAQGEATDSKSQTSRKRRSRRRPRSGRKPAPSKQGE
ncbi:MAG: stage 0 sporulation family protein [Desulfuromonadales bacterium]|nr:stage 0 sporulation family protein [Desulfuromonadales bacterium]